LALREKQLGLDHPDALHRIHGLAIVFQSLGRQKEVEVLCHRMMYVKEGKLGVERPDIPPPID
jgi:hypothetical protein